MLAFKIFLNRRFDYFISAVVILNGMTLLLVHYNMSSTYQLVLGASNYVFTAIYVLEFLLKVYGLGFKSYIHNVWNRLDLVIVIISIIEVALVASEALHVLQLLRLLRIVRVLKLVSKLKGLREMIMTLVW